MRSLSRFIGIAVLSSHALATCFFPNGDESPADTPCNPDALVSQCCYKNQACLSNGLCVSDPYDPKIARLHRGTCSDKSWTSSDCPNHCTTVADNGVPVYSCNQTNVDSYCCFDNCECNAQYETFKFASDDVYTITIISEVFTQTHTATSSSKSASTQSSSSQSSSSTSKTKSATAASVSASATNTHSSSSNNQTNVQDKDEKSSSSSVAIGMGVGVGVGAALLISALVALLFWRRNKRQQERGPAPLMDSYQLRDQKPVEIDDTAYNPAPPVPTKYAYYAEADQSFASPTELPVGLGPAELPANPKHHPDYKIRLA